MIRTKQQRQADRDWCEQFMDDSDHGDGVVLGVAVGAFIWVVVMALFGWLG